MCYSLCRPKWFTFLAVPTQIRSTQTVKPGKGGAFNQLELRDVRSGAKKNARVRASETVETVRGGG